MCLGGLQFLVLDFGLGPRGSRFDAEGMVCWPGVFRTGDHVGGLTLSLVSITVSHRKIACDCVREVPTTYT